MLLRCARWPRMMNALLLALYFSAGIVVLTLEQDWTPLTSLYVVVQIITTVGYGDVTISHGGKVFMTCYVLLGTVIVANIVNSLFDSLLHSAEHGLEESLHNIENKLTKAEKRRPAKPSAWHQLGMAVAIYLFFVVTWAIFFFTVERCSCSYGSSHIGGCVSDRCEETGGYKKRLIDAVYMAVITFSTVGFGDYAPKSRAGRLFGSIWMILGVLSFGNLVGKVTKVLHRTTSMAKKRPLMTRTLFDSIDTDGTGTIDQQEFQKYILVREGLVSAETFAQIDRLFQTMDRDKNGTLTFEEIQSNLMEMDVE